MVNSSAVSKYLRDMLHSFPTYSLTQADKEAIKEHKAEWITKILLTKKFRKTKVFEQTKNSIMAKVELSLKENKPLHFVILFGGYKAFWNPSHPEVDWAELFNLRFMTELFSPILQAYGPGVILDYGSEDLIITEMDNYPKTVLDSYAASFKTLLAAYSKSLPTNFKINYVRTGEMYDSSKLKQELWKILPQKKEEWKHLSEENKKNLLHRSYRSIMWKGEKDLTNLNEAQKEERIAESKIIENTFYELEANYFGDYFTGGNRIPIVLSWGLSKEENVDHWLTLGSTYASTTDFWIGRGVLELRDGRFIPRVLSKNQYSDLKPRLASLKVDILDVKNLKQIEIYSEN